MACSRACGATSPEREGKVSDQLKKLHDAASAKSITFRIEGALQEKLADIVRRANENRAGKKRIRAIAVVEYALDLVTEEHISALRNQILTNSERLQIMHRGYKYSHGEISFDEFVGKLVSGQLVNPKKIKQYLSDGFGDAVS
jgi:hypothetical protein